MIGPSVTRASAIAAVLWTLASVSAAGAGSRDVWDRVQHHYAENAGVRIHYATLGRGPLVVMIHGFPDCWYTWRDQMVALQRHYRVAAMDLRGYNLSDQPAGTASYDLSILVEDAAAVIRSEGRERAIVVGHDWGGAVAWMLAMTHPELVERLVVLNLPHPRAILRELRENPAQQAASGYARIFQQEGAHLSLTIDFLTFWVTDPEARARYVEAFQRSSFESMLAYYKQNYPREPYADIALPTVEPPVLLIHGLADPFLLAAGLDRTWEYVARPLTLVTIPGAGHFVQQDASALVTKTIKRWLADQGARR